MKRLRHVAALMAGLLAPALAVSADSYPTRPIHIISPHQPGGTAETFARIMTNEMSQALGQPIVIETRPGAAGTIGAREVALSAPDGYKALVNASIQVMYPGMFKNLSFDPREDFVPVGVFGSSPIVLAVSSRSTINSFQDLIDAARAKPGSITFASGGLGSLPHLVGELVSQSTGVEMVHVPYNGTAPAASDVAAGHVPVLYSAAPSVEAMIKGGRMKALAVTSATRMPSLPDVPTLQELGLADFDATAWYALWVPKGTAPAIVDRLNKAMRDASALPAVQQRMKTNGIIPSAMNAEEFGRFERAEGARWLEVMKRANLQPN